MASNLRDEMSSKFHLEHTECRTRGSLQTLLEIGAANQALPWDCRTQETNRRQSGWQSGWRQQWAYMHKN